MYHTEILTLNTITTKITPVITCRITTNFWENVKIIFIYFEFSLENNP